MSEQLKDTFVASMMQTCEQAMLKLEHCLKQLDSQQVWSRLTSDQNSVGNLLLHVGGNLKQWGVVPFSQINDSRDRPSEFAHRDIIPTSVLLDDLRQTLQDASQIWQALQEEQLTQDFEIQGFRVTGCFAISHTVSHLVGHTHQVILLTRQLLGSAYQFHWTPEEKRTDVPI